jgi:hypothetical protein
MKTLAKTLIGTVAAGAVAMASATPAVARDRYHDHDGISAGEVIAGALVVGGIAALAASSHDNYRYNDYRYRGYNGYYQNPRNAVEQCVYAAQQSANRYSYGGRSRVTDIRDIDRDRDGYTVRGRIAVNTRNAYWSRGWGNDWRGWNSAYRGYDAGSFTCKVRYGRVVGMDFHNIRGL